MHNMFHKALAFTICNGDLAFRTGGKYSNQCLTFSKRYGESRIFVACITRATIASAERDDERKNRSQESNVSVGDSHLGEMKQDKLDLSPTVLSLLKEQLARPVFNPKEVEGPLSLTFETLQQSGSGKFITSDEIPVDLDNEGIREAVDILSQEHAKFIAFARKTVQETFPGITSPGGKLHPETRSQACWRDLQSFARVTGYAIVTGGTGFSDEGFETLEKVYRELNVPMNAMLVGVDAIRRAAVLHAFELFPRSKVSGNTSDYNVSDRSSRSPHPDVLLDTAFRQLMARLKTLRKRLCTNDLSV